MIVATVALVFLSSSPGIVPGERLGKVSIGETGESVAAQLGKPKLGDAAMGHFWSTWISHGQYLDVYSTRGEEDVEAHVRLVRATSPSFRTRDGLGPGSPERLVRKAFPAAKRVGSYREAPGKPPTIMFDDAAQGIEYEVRQGRCVAMAVHERGQSVNEQYAPLIAILKNRKASEGRI